MKAYLDIVRNILENGVEKQPVRVDKYGNAVKVENGTIGTFCEVFRHDMSDGFPLLTCRKLPFKNTCVELEGFIKGITSKKWFQDRGCPYWNFWANPEVVNKRLNVEFSYDDSMTDQEGKDLYASMKKQIQLEEDDLGPLGYSWQWRKFGEHYPVTWDGGPEGFQERKEVNGVEKGFDQLAMIVDKLKNNPYDRRMVCSAWNPNQLHMMSLPPCHVSFSVVVYGNKLNLMWKQRSADTLLGISANIASYATLLMLLAQTANLECGELVGVFTDCHIYNNQIEGAKKLVQREPRPLPELVIESKDIFDWTYEDRKLIGYDPHPNDIDFGSITV